MSGGQDEMVRLVGGFRWCGGGGFGKPEGAVG